MNGTSMTLSPAALSRLSDSLVAHGWFRRNASLGGIIDPAV